MTMVCLQPCFGKQEKRRCGAEERKDVLTSPRSSRGEAKAAFGVLENEGTLRGEASAMSSRSVAPGERLARTMPRTEVFFRTKALSPLSETYAKVS
jgi:hypothetical protein